MCSIKTCKNKKYKKDFCRKHYQIKRNAGEFGQYTPRILWKNALCEIKDCSNKIHAKGFCSIHYSRLLKQGNPELIKRVSKYNETCKVIFPEGGKCIKKAYAKYFCKKHYIANHRYGNPLIDKTVKATKNNYVALFRPDHPNANKDGFILEHRFIMSNHIGRALLPGENVHHKNGNRKDNRLSNLELWSEVQPSGQRIEDKLEWAREIISLYGTPEEIAALSK